MLFFNYIMHPKIYFVTRKPFVCFVVSCAAYLLMVSVVRYALFSIAPALNNKGGTPRMKYDENALLLYENWLNTFQAANPAFQSFCLNALQTGHAASQFSQDMWLFHNIFKKYALANRTGFYVDSGANHWRDMSNTFFYDVCLGWKGVCVEPSAQYHDGLLKHRSCDLVPTCIAASTSSVHLSGEGTHVVQGGDLQCLSLEAMLGQRFKNDKGQYEIDLWSLDVEGYELNVLSGLNFSNVNISVLLVEDFWISQRQLDEILLNHVPTIFQKAKQFPIDSLFIQPDVFDLPSFPWYPHDWGDFVSLNKIFRAQMMQANKLTCE
jgi:hypothetical protein